ncbi:hypothetical protein [Patulibacter sp.]|uniref:hypothetical protein n=1 Tax=Patulibacter sp. TaxID=1912859 RepID=UPI002724CBFB|nr:hypothetical protein [Patulibacter sp.]MDO9408836.1 hypothetical protein [Patulibacter sp.]
MTGPVPGAGTHPNPLSRLRGYGAHVRAQNDEYGRLIPWWVARLFAVCAVLLIPWSAFLVLTLPGHTTAHAWNLAWAGFDVGMAVVLGATAFAVVTRSVWSGPLAAAAGTMLLVDAWFDVTTSAPGAEQVQAIAMAVLVEIPLALLLLATARHIGLVVVQARRYLEAADVHLVGGRLVGPDGAPAVRVSRSRGGGSPGGR